MKRRRTGSSSCSGDGTEEVAIVNTTRDNSDFNEHLRELLARPDGYKEIFCNLIAQTTDAFFKDCWETKPCLFVRKRSGTLLPQLFSKDTLLDVLSEQTISFSTNMTICRYVNKERTAKEIPGPYATREFVSKTFSDGYTTQFYQPQRFVDALHHINAGFEHTFGVLAGSSAYLTPAGAQGLAPHYDDVEVFILQTEGNKLWRVWERSNRFQRLPEQCSFDIPRDELPEKFTEIVLHEGDVLYLPRGTIHEAAATDAFSTHITISVYQRNSYKTLLDSVIPELLQTSFDSDIEMRGGLPVQFGNICGSFVRNIIGSNFSGTSQGETGFVETPTLARRDEILKKVRGLLHTMADNLTHDMIDSAADKLLSYTTQHRLPPPDLLLEEEDQEVKLKETSVVRIIDPSSFFCFISKNESPDAQHQYVLSLAHCKYNDRQRHMDHPRPHTIKTTADSQPSSLADAPTGTYCIWIACGEFIANKSKLIF